jgi:hypothetical protein
MIVYPLACGEGHHFEGWFASAEACEKQAAAGQLSCPSCASLQVRKLPSAPYVKGSTQARAAVPDELAVRAKALEALRRFLLEKTENVGTRFPEVARRIHYGEEPERAIRGKAPLEEAAELHEEGISTLVVAPDVIPTEDVH